MKRSLRTLAIALPALLCAVSPATAADRPNFDAYFKSGAGAQLVGPSLTPAMVRAAGRLGVVGARDAKRGVPTLLWAAKNALPQNITRTPTAAAR